MNHEVKEPIGSLRISKDVLATIATNAAKEIEGVAGIAPFTTNIKNWITKKQSAVPMPVFISLHDDIAVIDHILSRRRVQLFTQKKDRSRPVSRLHTT